MIFGIGIDIVEIHRIKDIVGKRPNFLVKYFTIQEIEYFQSKKNNYESIAGYFAAKEAVSKALGVGIGEIRLSDIEVLKDSHNRPYVALYNKARAFAEKNHIQQVHISISHSKEYAVANALAILKAR